MRGTSISRIVVAVGAGAVALATLWGGPRAAAGEPAPGHGAGMKEMPLREPPAVSDEQARAEVEDARIFVPMPPAARKNLSEQMRQFLTTLMEVQGLMVEGKLEEAAEIAETRMGRTERGAHAGQPGGAPGVYMPVPMRAMAWGLHDLSSEFADTARTGDVKASYLALQQMQAACVNCHSAYRTR